MNRLANLTVRTSWLLVLLVFTALVLGVGGLGGYAVQYSQSALRTFNEVDVIQKSTLNRANSGLLALRLDIQTLHRRMAAAQSINGPSIAMDLAGQLASLQSILERLDTETAPDGLASQVSQVKADHAKLMSDEVAPLLAALRSQGSRNFVPLDEAEKLSALSSLEEQAVEVQGVFEEFFAMPIPSEHQALVKRVKADYEKLFHEGIEPQLSAMKSGNLDVYAGLADKANALNETFYASEVDYFVTVEKQGSQLYQDFQGTALALNVAIVMSIVVSLVLIVLVLWGVTINVLRPLRRVIEHFEHMAAGDLSARIEKRGTNEIGQLFTALARMQEGLVRTVHKVRSGSHRIHDGARHIARGNVDLSSRTEQQAASLEETASSMEQLTATVTQNADNARQASQLSQSASRTAERGGAVVGEVVDTMRDISDSSHKIVGIIDVIDSIAFQTNILALNASVEAARAGEQGRGFAVVASEVRTLASRSSDAAKEIRGLIEASVTRVDAGTRLVDEAGTTMADIVAAVRRVNDIMDEIASASQEQSNGISQVNQAIVQMDQVTQQNASLVQQAATGASGLENDADALREAVALFRLSESEASTMPSTPRYADPGQPSQTIVTTASAQRKPAAIARHAKAPEPEWEEF